mgnify:CR=1 FL=1
MAAAPNCNSTLTVSKIQDLDFGNYVGTTGGTITVDASGVRTATAWVILVGGGAPAAAVYTLSNTVNHCNNQWVDITLQGSATISGPASMTINNFSSSAPSNRIKIRNTPTVTVGADLITNNSQIPGTYNGNFSVDFSY